MKVCAIRPPNWILLLVAIIPIFSSIPAWAANPADWKTFTSAGKRNWSVATNWTDATGIPTPGSSLVINFDPSRTGTVTAGGKISSPFEVTNDLGTVQLNTLNLAGESNGSARTITIRDGILQFAGDAPAINNTTTGTVDTVKYVLNNSLLLDTNLALNLNGTSEMTLLGISNNTLSASSAGLKTITAFGAGKCILGGNSSAAISNGAGQVGITMAGTGVLTIGGQNTFTGDLLIKSGTVRQNAASAGSAYPTVVFGAGAIKLGDSAAGNANAMLQFTAGGSGFTCPLPITVQAGNSGVKTIDNAGGNFAMALAGPLVLNDNVVISYSGTAGGYIKLGTSSTAECFTGAGDMTFISTGATAHSLYGNNTNFTGDIVIKSGGVRLIGANALSATNTVFIDSQNGATFIINGQNQTIAGLNDGENGGGVVINTNDLRTLTLGGCGTYSFSGPISATTATNLAITVALTGQGTQTLWGDCTYAGATLVNRGTLLVNGSLAAGSVVTVGTNGTLGGNGIIRGPTTVNGTLAPGGNDRGTLTFGGNAIFSEKAKYNWDYIGGTGDVVSVTGNLQLPASATVNVSVATRVPTQPSVLFQAGSLSGSGATTVSGWTVTDGYSVAIQGTSILLMPPPDPRTMILVR